MLKAVDITENRLLNLLNNMEIENENRELKYDEDKENCECFGRKSENGT